MKYIMLRFYEGGGLARFETVNCKEDDLDEKLAEFEEDCANNNEGVFVAVLEEKEFNAITRELKG